MRIPIILTLITGTLLMSGYIISSFIPVRQDSFSRGERLGYQVNFGWFSVGDAETLIDEKLKYVNGRPSYKIDVYGKTTGMVDWLAKVDDHWGAVIDTAALVPHVSYRNIKEGNYRKNEVTRFDHISGVAETKTLDQKTGKYKEPEVYETPRDIRDLLAGFLYMRSQDYSQMKPGDSFQIKGFLEDTVYHMDLVYEGKEKVKTKAGKFRAIKLTPIMPDGDLFDGKRSVHVWISDDRNHIPLLIKAKMFIGSTSIELKDYDRLRNPLESRM